MDSQHDVPNHKMPVRPSDITPELLNAIIKPWHPGITVTGTEILKAHAFGDGMVSTAARASVALAYSADSPAGLPPRVVFKLTRDETTFIGPVYANEVKFYNLLRPEMTDIEVPQSLGGAYDPQTQQFGLVLGDLTLEGAHFPNVTESVSVAHVRHLLDLLARLHASYWESPRFSADLSWVETHLAGALSRFMYEQVPFLTEYEVAHENFKRELVEQIGKTERELLADLRRLHEHQARLPQTLLHGDAHIGNSYVYPGGRVGLLDWQLSVRGYFMHDVAYLITTALTTGTRRKTERALLAYYLDRLRAYGVAEAPSIETGLREFGLTLTWCLYIGWLTVPLVNYGWEISLLNHLRIAAAYSDHETARLTASLD